MSILPLHSNKILAIDEFLFPIILDSYPCRCKKCNPQLIHYGLLLKVLEMKNVFPDLIITCGYRCREHNKEVGGVENSQHVLGKAVDVTTSKGLTKELEEYARHSDFNGIGIYYDKGFIHLDERDGKKVMFEKGDSGEWRAKHEKV